MIRGLSAIVALLLPAPAFAQEIDPNPGRLEIIGLAPSACLIRTPGSAIGDNATFQPSGPSAGQITIGMVVDPSTGQSRGASLDLILPIICNSPHRVVLRSGTGGLRRVGAPAAPQGQFGELLPYRVDAVWGPNQEAMTTGGEGTLIIDSAGARAGQLSLSFSVAPGGQPLVAGTYSDEIVLELQAAN